MKLCPAPLDLNSGHKFLVRINIENYLSKIKRFYGNDLSTPMTEFGFPGLQEGDRWCLCLARWKEAYDVGKAPHIYLASTHEASLELVPLEVLLDFAVDVNWRPRKLYSGAVLLTSLSGIYIKENSWPSELKNPEPSGPLSIHEQKRVMPWTPKVLMPYRKLS